MIRWITLLICCSDFVCYVSCHRLFSRAGTSYQFYFVSGIISSTRPTFTAQLSAVSDIAEIKCTTLKNCYHYSVIQGKCEKLTRFLRVRLLIGQLNFCSKWAKLLGNSGCVEVSSFLGVLLPTFSPILSDIRRSFPLLEGTQGFACLSF